MPSGGGSPALVSEVTEVCPAHGRKMSGPGVSSHVGERKKSCWTCADGRLRGHENHKAVLRLQQ